MICITIQENLDVFDFEYTRRLTQGGSIPSGLAEHRQSAAPSCLLMAELAKQKRVGLAFKQILAAWTAFLFM